MRRRQWFWSCLHHQTQNFIDMTPVMCLSPSHSLDREKTLFCFDCLFAVRSMIESIFKHSHNRNVCLTYNVSRALDNRFTLCERVAPTHSKYTQLAVEIDKLFTLNCWATHTYLDQMFIDPLGERFLLNGIALVCRARECEMKRDRI